MGIIGGIVGAVGAIAQANAASNAADYQAQVAQNNAIIAQQNATYASEAGHIQAENKSEEGAQQYGLATTALAANGIDVNTGSALRVRQGIRAKNVLDTETTLNNAELQGYGYQTQATGYQAQAGLYSQEASADMTGGVFNAFGSIAKSLPQSGGTGYLGFSGSPTTFGG